MDSKMMHEHLALAERHVAEGDRHLSRQRALIAELKRDGHGTGQAIDLLRTLEDTQATFIADRDRIRNELSKAE
jgi:hypothetical protein